MTTWAELFSAVTSVSGAAVEPRQEQALMGQAIIDAFEVKTNLIAEAKTGTGKSYATLIPLIDRIKKAPPGKKVRGAVSTETMQLQNQLVNKDLPALHAVYGGFTYRMLKGRSNYLCMNALRLNARGTPLAAKYLETLEKQLGRVGDGERGDVERVLGIDLDDKAWDYLAGSPIGCGENDCTPDGCYSARARALALQANIVVVNHALLRVDADSVSGDTTGMVDNFLGPLDYLIVDEAHTLEGTLSDGWTTELTEWEIFEMSGKVTAAVDAARAVSRDANIGYVTQQATDAIHDFMKSVTRFYSLLHSDEDWDRVKDSICLKTVMGGASPGLVSAMNSYEIDGPKALEDVLSRFETIHMFLKDAIEKAMEQQTGGLRPMRKGLRAIVELRLIIKRILEAMKTKDGLIVEYGTPYGVVLDGYYRRDGKATVKLSVVPLDVSRLSDAIWAGRTCVLTSATLTDLTDGTFRYTADSLGFSEYSELRTGSPFDYAQQQVVYVTTGNRTLVDIPGARYSFEEMIELVRASNGRSLVLFTARGELDDAAYKVRQLVANGEFPWPVLVQDKGTNKQKLADQFKNQEHSVLFATKSFFTGVDFPGDTCSLVAICKFPLPQYNIINKMKITWWRRRGYSKWYEREALTIFAQASGRLIRAGSDRGVVALLDNRVTISGDRVAQTARLGVESLGSGVTRSIEDVKVFLS